MGFKKYRLGELGKKLLIDFRIANHFHVLLTGRDILIIDLAVTLPNDPIEHDTHFLAGRFWD